MNFCLSSKLMSTISSWMAISCDSSSVFTNEFIVSFDAPGDPSSNRSFVFSLSLLRSIGLLLPR